ncbi:hypothetical protein SORBI_3001G351300 [Sorghum bicolor]|uniref:Uncharacterized protein n=1 Tax=Sorghum bicolor TaxID=4558 RepID=A0A1B6QMU2_SORBI|nr:hypothetical protein SORBI_3001G351300 [Sorghum bicolor]
MPAEPSTKLERESVRHTAPHATHGSYLDDEEEYESPLHIYEESPPAGSIFSWSLLLYSTRASLDHVIIYIFIHS